jgi:hypothetical protein
VPGSGTSGEPELVFGPAHKKIYDAHYLVSGTD